MDMNIDNELLSEAAFSKLQEGSALLSLFLRVPVMTGQRIAFPIGNFRQRAVFLEEVQYVYKEEYLSDILTGSQGTDLIQILHDPLGTAAVLVLVKDICIIFGPFVIEAYQEKNCRQRLMRFFRCDSSLLLQFKLYWCDLSICDMDTVIKAAQSLLEYAGIPGDDCPVIDSASVWPGRKPDRNQMSSAQLPPWRRDELKRVEERYALETEMMTSISAGNADSAIASLRKMLQQSRPQAGMAVDLWSFESAAAIMRSLIRISAKNSGLSAVIIDSISLDYAQKMRYGGNDPRKMTKLYEEMISGLCHEIQKLMESDYSPLTRRAWHLIRRYYAEPISIVDISEALEVSESTLSRSLKSDTGRTFTQLLQEARMHAAASLLSSSQAPVHMIAEKVGIPDQNYFVKLFRKAYHQTPTEYRAGRH